jgi:hypothetical protein
MCKEPLSFMLMKRRKPGNAAAGQALRNLHCGRYCCPMRHMNSYFTTATSISCSTGPDPTPRSKVHTCAVHRQPLHHQLLDGCLDRRGAAAVLDAAPSEQPQRVHAREVGVPAVHQHVPPRGTRTCTPYGLLDRSSRQRCHGCRCQVNARLQRCGQRIDQHRLRSTAPYVTHPLPLTCSHSLNAARGLHGARIAALLAE